MHNNVYDDPNLARPALSTFSECRNLERSRSLVSNSRLLQQHRTIFPALSRVNVEMKEKKRFSRACNTPRELLLTRTKSDLQLFSHLSLSLLC